MSVRKRLWSTRKGEKREAWVVDYVDQQGKRLLKTFDRKKEADTFAGRASVEISEGTHVADSASKKVKEAGELWLKSAEDAGLERTTLDQYRQHLRLHIVPFLGNTPLSKLNAPTIRQFEDTLRDAGRSPTLVRYVRRSLGSILADSQERGYVVRNAVRDLRSRRRKGKDEQQSARKGKLKIGVDIPTLEEIKTIVSYLNGVEIRRRALFLTVIFSGVRASELRGLRWVDVDIPKGELHVRQRADRYQSIGKPKTEAGERTITLIPTVTKALREWSIGYPRGDLDLVFPNGDGGVEWHSNIIQRMLIPTLIEAGVKVPVKDADGKSKLNEDGSPMYTAKYTGLHALRHFFASWCLNRVADGGRGLSLQIVQALMGHSSITVTIDTYGHLFPRGDDRAELAEAERALLG